MKKHMPYQRHLSLSISSQTLPQICHQPSHLCRRTCWKLMLGSKPQLTWMVKYFMNWSYRPYLTHSHWPLWNQRLRSMNWLWNLTKISWLLSTMQTEIIGLELWVRMQGLSPSNLKIFSLEEDIPCVFISRINIELYQVFNVLPSPLSAGDPSARQPWPSQNRFIEINWIKLYVSSSRHLLLKFSSLLIYRVIHVS